MDSGKIGIVTIVDNDNFGNRLQNYALQECLVARGWAVETIPNTPAPMRRSLMAARAVAAIRAEGPVAVGRRNAGLLVDRLRHRRRPTTYPPRAHPARREAIGRFTREHINELSDHDTSLDGLGHVFDKVVVGSDQVWNPGFRHANEIDFLTFARPEQRVAYAASFGVPDVPAFLRPPYSRWLAGIPHLSVREQRAAEIVHDLTGRTVPVVADPTLLVDPQVWHARAHTPQVLRGRRYLATFFLGHRAPEESEALADHARAGGLDVVDLADTSDPVLAAMSPFEFIGAIRDADVLATDSFHAAVFSLVFERDSITTSRHADDTRLDTLFATAGIERTPWHTNGLNRTRPPEWSCVRQRLEDHRRESRQFLDAAVGRPTPVGGTQ